MLSLSGKSHFLYLLILVTSLSLVACSSSDDDDSEEPADNNAGSEAVVTLLIADSEGLPLENVTAVSSDYQIKSQSSGSQGQLLVTLESLDEDGILVLRKAGYIESLVYLNDGSYPQRRFVTLLESTDPILVDMINGGRFAARDGAAVDIPADSLQFPDGSLASGDVELYITPIDTNNVNEFNASPGSLLGVAESYPDAAIPLFTFGMVNMSFYKDGQELQLRDGYSADLTLPLYVSKHVDGSDINVGDTIPFWILNEATGIWEQYGEGMVISDPLSKTGLALSASTSHFSWFNTDAWGRPGTNPNGQADVGPGNNWCRLSINLLGVEEGTRLETTISRLAIGFPSSTVTRAFAYAGMPISSVIPRGSGYSILVRDVNTGNEAQETFVCSDGSDVTRLLDLDPEGPPVFYRASAIVKPNFTLHPDTFVYEINSNRVILGYLFSRDADDDAVVNADFFATPLLMQDGIAIEETYTASDASPTVITATLDNEYGSVTANTQIEYVSEASPEVEYVTVVNRPGNITQFVWEVIGADTVSITELGDVYDANTVGIPYFDPDPNNHPFPESPAFDATGLYAYTGYLRVTFSNQYGDTDVYVYLNSADICPIGSDLCVQQ